jgi:hypothetical protein
MNPTHQTPTTAADVMQVLGEQDATFPTNEEIGSQTHADVLNTERGDSDTLLGFLVVTQTGTGSSIAVPHDELVQKMEALDFPPAAIPESTKPYRAYNRAKKDLVGEVGRVRYLKGSFTDEEGVEHDHEYEVKFTVENNSRYVQTVMAKVLLPEEECGEEGGRFETVLLGKIRLNKDKGSPEYEADKALVSGGSNLKKPLRTIWVAGFVTSMEERFAHHRSHHNADDVSSLLDRMRTRMPHSIGLRRATYFYPAVTGGLQGLLDRYQTLYGWLNSEDYKVKGESMKFWYTPLFDHGNTRQFLGEQLEEHLKAEIESLVSDLADSLADDDETAEALARDVLAPALQEMDSTVQQYDAIADRTPKVKRLLRQHAADLAGDASERAEAVIAAAEDRANGAERVDYDASDLDSEN